MNHQTSATVKDTDIVIEGTRIRKLTKRSKYLISYMINIFKKDMLLKCLSKDESIWDSEIKGSKRIRKMKFNVYDYPRRGILCNAVKQGKLTECGKNLIENKL